MTDAFVRLSDYRSARAQTAAELDRIEEALRVAGVSAEIDRGATDEGHPWVTFARPGDGEVIAHVAVIDSQFVIDSPAFTRPLWGREMAPLLAKLLERLRLTGTSNSLLSLALIACAVALAAVHIAERDAAGWTPLDADSLPAEIEAIGILPALTVVRTAQAIQATADETQYTPDPPVELARGAERAAAPLEQAVEGSPSQAQPEPLPAALAPAPPAEPNRISAPAPAADIPALLRKGDTVDLVIGRGADTAGQIVATTVKTAPEAWIDPREAQYAMMRVETMASIARGDLVGSDVATALNATEAYIRAQRAGVTKVDVNGKDVTLYTTLDEPLQVYQFKDHSSMTLVGVSSASPVE
jgi:hypothetical protein